MSGLLARVFRWFGDADSPPARSFVPVASAVGSTVTARPPAEAPRKAAVVPMERRRGSATPGQTDASIARPQSAANEQQSGEAVPPNGSDDQKQVRVFRDVGEIPAHLGIVTTPEGGVPVAKSDQQLMIGLLLADRASVLMLVVPGKTHYLAESTLAERMRSKGFDVSSRGYATEAVIRELYERDARRRESDTEINVDMTAETAVSVKRFKEFIEEAIRLDASDIHIEIREQTGMVLYRLDGEIVAGKDRRYERSVLMEVIGVAFTKLAEPNSRSDPSWNENAAQDCMITYSAKDGRQFRVRYQRSPVAGGTSTVLRLLNNGIVETSFATLASLGFEVSHQEMLSYACRRANGLNLVTGPTGSGKSTTLKVVITTDPNASRIKCYSIEDPVEYKMPKVSQMQVPRVSDSSRTNAYLTPLKVVLRMDPDAVMVGEIRGADAGELVASMVMTGHRVYSTVHANSAIEAIGRLASSTVAIPRDVLAGRSFIGSLTHQALLPKLCPHCSRPGRETLPGRRQRLLEEKFGIDVATVRTANLGGCDKCHEGTKGRTAAIEVVVPSGAMRKLILTGNDLEAEEVWRRTRRTGFMDSDCTGKTAFEHGLLKVSRGEVDPAAVEAAFEAMETYEVVPAEGGRTKAAVESA